MKKFIVEIKIDNDAFHPIPQYEVARILNTVAKKIDESDFDPEQSNGFYLFDCNGNRCGKAYLSEE
jgi:hypothetical protein